MKKKAKPHNTHLMFYDKPEPGLISILTSIESHLMLRTITKLTSRWCKEWSSSYNDVVSRTNLKGR